MTRHLAKWGLVDKEDQKSKKENKTSAQKSLPSSLSLPDEAQVSFGQVEAEALDQVPEDIPTPVPDSDSQEALPNPEPAVVAPETMPQVPSALVSNLAGLLDSIVRFGGMPHFISYDCGVVLMGSHQKISVLDENLKTLAAQFTKAPVYQAACGLTDGKTRFYLAELGNILEVFEMDASFQISSLGSVAMLGTVHFFKNSKNQIYAFVAASDKVQMYALNSVTDMVLISELPVKEVSNLVAYQGYYYLAEENRIKVVREADFSVLSEIPFDKPFVLLDVWEEQKAAFLVVLVKNPSTQSLDWLQLVPLSGSGGISDLGRLYALGESADDFSPDIKNNKIIFWKNPDQVFNFDLVTKQGSVLSLADKANIISLDAKNDKVVVAHENGVSLYHQAESGEESSLKGRTPLAFQGGAKTVQKLSKSAELSLPGRISSILLAGERAYLRGDKGFFIVPSIKSDPIEILSHTIKNLPAQARIMAYGGGSFWAFSEDTGKIYQVSSDFSSSSMLALPAQKIQAMAYAVIGDQQALFLAKNKSNGVSEGSLSVYTLGKKIQKLAELKTPPLFSIEALPLQNKVLAACGEKGVCVFDFGLGLNKLALSTTIPAIKPGFQALGVRLAPHQKTAYVFYKTDQGQVSVAVMNILPNITVASILNKLAMDKNQFMGLSFSMGGNTLLLPHAFGVSFFDMTHPAKPKLIHAWEVGATFGVDVTNRGKTICVALGSGGVACGKFNPP